ncbi:E3 ubiquitin-protein ligase TRIM39-like [Gastrophryne carolinensis]
MASAGLREELECSICLSVYTDPVTLKCGHNFCRNCIVRVLETQEEAAVYSCPQCREEFQERPALHRNITLRNIAENLLSAQPGPEGGVTLCSHCVDSPVAAVKSCLLCEVSLCEKHLRVHKQSPEHVLTDPTTNPETRKCSVHKEILKYYCTQDAACICVSCCLIGPHKGHNMQSLEEASEEKKRKLRKLLQEMMTKREKTEKRVQRLRGHQTRVQETSAGETERVTALFREIRRQLDDLEKRVLSDISQQTQRLSSHLSDIIQQLEIKMAELSSKMGHTEEMCNATDPLTVLQDQDTGHLCDTEEGEEEEEEEGEEEEDRDRHDLDMAGISHTVHTGMSDIIKWIKRGVYTVEDAEISLDVNTAYNEIIISDDLKSVSWGHDQNRPDTPERFMDYPQVLSPQSFSSGRHSWELDVGGGGWSVGMCYPSIERRGDQSRIGWNKKSWSLERWDDQHYVRHDSKDIPLPSKILSNRIRVYLDYEAGQISFYELSDPIRHLHTFTTTFTEPLHAGLVVIDPITISTVSQ